MSLISLPAFLTRTREDTTMTDTDTTTEKPLMRFATLGGAEVHVGGGYRNPIHCLGCDYQRDCSSVVYARDFANDHAGECRSMPKPVA